MLRISGYTGTTNLGVIGFFFISCNQLCNRLENLGGFAPKKVYPPHTLPETPEL